jgi:hypothetical protein
MVKDMLRRAATWIVRRLGMFDGVAPPELMLQLNVFGDVDPIEV